MEKIKIGNKLIDERKPCFIIAEAGVNHNGRLDLAEKLVDVARKAGADAIKFQTFKSGGVVSEKAEIADYQKKNMGKKEAQLKILKKLELDYKDFTKLKKYCDKKGIIFLSTPHSPDAIDFLEPLVPAYKIGSGDLTNLPFLKKIAGKKKPIILSTGMSNLQEVKEAVRAIKGCGNKKIILLHCTTNYPCPIEEVNLRAIQTLKQEFNLPVGYSDHTLGVTVPIMAVIMGAQVLEKHFTLDKNLPGPDHKASLDPRELRELIKEVREVNKLLGSGEKKPTQGEKRIMKSLRKSIVASEDIPKGSVIKRGMVVIKRPATGIQPKELTTLLGKRVKETIKKDEPIIWKKVEK